MKIKILANIKNVVANYVKNNHKEYILVTIIFVIGIFMGVMYINSFNESQQDETSSYITNFIEKLKEAESVNKKELMKSSINSSLITSIIIYLAGTTIIGMPIVLGLILFRGFCLGTTVSIVSCAIGTGKGIVFCILALFLQSIIFIPALITMGVSGIKLYKAIINDRRKENIKMEIIRHTMVSFIMMGIMIFSGIIESKISINLLKMGIKYWI